MGARASYSRLFGRNAIADHEHAAIVRAIYQVQGVIEFESRPGRTTFRILLPLT